MSVYEIRKRRLKDLIEVRFSSQTDFSVKSQAKGLKLSPSYVSRWFLSKERGGKHLGEGLARKIEKAHGLPSGWLDQDNDQKVLAVLDARGPYAPDKHVRDRIYSKVKRLDEDTQLALELIIDAMLGIALKHPKQPKPARGRTATNEQSN